MATKQKIGTQDTLGGSSKEKLTPKVTFLGTQNATKALSFLST